MMRSRDRKRVEDNARKHAALCPNQSRSKKRGRKPAKKQATPQQIVFAELCRSGVDPQEARAIAYQ